jgi:hypothetical protein
MCPFSWDTDLTATVNMPNWPKQRRDILAIRHNRPLIVIDITRVDDRMADQTNIFRESYKLSNAADGQRRRGHPD